MTTSIPESDWKVFRRVHALALDRFCERILAEVATFCAKRDSSPHERYLAVYRLVTERNREIAGAFDDMRRSTAVVQLMLIHRLGLLEPDELAAFSPETRKRIELDGA